MLFRIWSVTLLFVLSKFIERELIIMSESSVIDERINSSYEAGFITGIEI
jgi:hypothetical protein